ncbi:hypothetical protein, partial [Kitasatospora sp. NPDC050463]|uniref:hypothetical protein n=1 Tax=Kitasatospora sp. NPDC050463 TaxID=3155786 RepID=UPI0034078115
PPCAYLMPQGYRIHSPTVRRTAPTSPNQVQYQLDRDTRISQAMTELGFRKRGRIIVERLNQAFDHSQQFVDKEHI